MGIFEMAYKFNERIEIEWLDVVEDPSWMTMEEATKVPTDVYCRAIGYFLKEDDNFIWISTTIGRRRKSTRSRTIIPKGMIQKIRRLSVKKEK